MNKSAKLEILRALKIIEDSIYNYEGIDAGIYMVILEGKLKELLNQIYSGCKIEKVDEDWKELFKLNDTELLKKEVKQMRRELNHLRLSFYQGKLPYDHELGA